MPRVLPARVAGFRTFETALAAIGRLHGALGGVHVAVDDLQIGQAPERKQCRPRRLAMLAPNAELRDPVIDLRGSEQAPA